ncbi:hypothetical protein [Serinicoccus kebangsaanensis]|uniref:hypothetical protein n=1 Tax=Serinicoccus kebangsaanensis TaxID=2602069 RepID=UPI00124D0B12|nr:hypothetical protein [Serinicoccus kebangsaanensis]
MSIDIEEQVRRELATSPTPPGLQLEAATTTRAAARAYRRRRAVQVVAAGAAVLLVPATLAWAAGDLPDPTARVLPASPWTCPVSGWHSEPVVDVDELAGVSIPLSTGDHVIAGLATGCPFDALVMALSSDGTAEDPTRLRTRLLIERDAGTEHQGAGFVDLPSDDGQALGLVLPRASDDLMLIGPGEVRTPAVDPRPVPGTGLEAAAIEGATMADRPLALLRRGGDGLLRTDWLDVGSPAPRAWSGEDPYLTDTWVAQDAQGQQWVMHGGEVRGPFAPSSSPRGFLFEHGDPSSVDLVVLTPGPGELVVDGVSTDPWEQLATDDTTATELTVTTTRLHLDELVALEVSWLPEGHSELRRVSLDD